MTHQQRTPLVRVINDLTIASFLIVFLTANVVDTKPVNSEQLLDARDELLSEEEALVPKTIEDDAAVAPLSPVHEEARRRWNRAKQLHHLLQPKRYIRNVVEPRNAPDTTNVTVPKYIQELYENLTRRDSVEQRTTRANTVRPLQTVANEQSDCTQFNFSLLSINTKEIIVKAELHLHLDRKTMITEKLHVVVNSSQSPPWSLPPFDIQPGDNVDQDKYVLDVSGIINSWIRQGVQYAGFIVNIYEASPKDAPLPCSQIEFFHSSSNEDTEPLLVVYSYDTELEKLDYKTVLKNLNKTEVRRRRNANPANDDVLQRRARDTTNTASLDPSCNLYSLNITNDNIPKMQGESVILPLFYDAKICGGHCGSSLPVVQELQHNVLVHMLQRDQEFRDSHNYTITRCCAPIKYDPLDVIVNPPPDSGTNKPFIRIIPNMKIVQCECLEIIDFTDVTV